MRQWRPAHSPLEAQLLVEALALIQVELWKAEATGVYPGPPTTQLTPASSPCSPCLPTRDVGAGQD